MAHGHTGARLAPDAQPHEAGDVLPAVEPEQRRRAGRRSCSGDSLATTRTGGAMRGSTIEPIEGHHARRGASRSASKPGRVAARLALPQVDDRSRRRGRPPGSRRSVATPLLVRDDAHDGEPSASSTSSCATEADLVAVVTAVVARVPAECARGTSRRRASAAMTFAPGHEQRGDVVRLGQEPVAVGRPARREERVARRRCPLMRTSWRPSEVTYSRAAHDLAGRSNSRRSDRGAAPGARARDRPAGSRPAPASRAASSRPASTRSVGLQSVQPASSGCGRGRSAPRGSQSGPPGASTATWSSPVDDAASRGHAREVAAVRDLDLVGLLARSGTAGATRQVRRTGSRTDGQDAVGDLAAKVDDGRHLRYLRRPCSALDRPGGHARRRSGAGRR